MNRKLRIGVFGLGTVASGVVEMLEAYEGDKLELGKLVVKNREKKRDIDPSLLFYDKEDILGDDSINLVIELTDNADEAYKVARQAMESGKHFITASKKLVAERLEELTALARKSGVLFLYEASVCGSIPVIRTLSGHYAGEEINSISGIFNGSSNYILSKMRASGSSYEQALEEAKEKGFAESDPILDVGGFDTKYKLVILMLHAFGKIMDPDRLLNLGIQNIRAEDIKYASSVDSRIKLLASAVKQSDGSIVPYVLPAMVKKGHRLYDVENEFNAVFIEAAYAGEEFLYGRGAGSHPTASAVFSDIMSVMNGRGYLLEKMTDIGEDAVDTNASLDIYIRMGVEIDNEKLKFVYVDRSWKEKGNQFLEGRVNLKDLFPLIKELEGEDIFIAVIV